MRVRPCPACVQPLSAGRLGPVSLELCLNCGGAWVTVETLKQVVAAGPAAIRRLVETLRVRSNPSIPKRPTLGCPGCERVLAGVEYPSMPGARLATCGICESYWLDLPALATIADHLQSTQAVNTRVSPTSAANPWATPAGGSAGDAPAPPASSTPPNPTAPGGFYAPPTQGAPAGASYYGAPPPTPPASGGEDPPGSAREASTDASYYGTPPTEVLHSQSAGKRPARGGGNGSARPGERLCESCGQPNSEKAPVCWACGHMFLGQIVGKCPGCAGSLHRINSDGIEIDACDACGGVWLERGRLSALVFQSREQQQWVKEKVREIAGGRGRKLKEEIICPDCGLIMFARTIGTITLRPIGTCPQCTANFLEPDAVDEVLGR